jgi:hypothetical protein
MTEIVTIDQDRYGELLDAELELYALYAAGVDNWEGFDDSRDILKEMKKEQGFEE